MQGRTIAWALAAGGLVVAAGSWLVMPEAAPRSERARVALPDSGAASRAAEERAASRPVAPAGEREGRHRQAIEFRAAVRNFFDHYRELEAEEREVQAAALRADIEARLASGLLLPPEALALELALLRAAEDDPAVVESERRRIVDAYREAAEAAGSVQRADPRDAQYRERQAEIAREVMAQHELPDGRSREDVLRERLRELRLEVYGGGGDPPQ